jgi:hypothetical protein
MQSIVPSRDEQDIIRSDRRASCVLGEAFEILGYIF